MTLASIAVSGPSPRGLITKKIVADINPKWLTNLNWPINTPASSAEHFLSLQALITREIVFAGSLSDGIKSAKSSDGWPQQTLQTISPPFRGDALVSDQCPLILMDKEIVQVILEKEPSVKNPLLIEGFPASAR
jgi:hypothetical protein